MKQAGEVFRRRKIHSFEILLMTEGCFVYKLIDKVYASGKHEQRHENSDTEYHNDVKEEGDYLIEDKLEYRCFSALTIVRTSFVPNRRYVYRIK